MNRGDPNEFGILAQSESLAMLVYIIEAGPAVNLQHQILPVIFDSTRRRAQRPKSAWTAQFALLSNQGVWTTPGAGTRW
jgi:hypothetical protein